MLVSGYGPSGFPFLLLSDCSRYYPHFQVRYVSGQGCVTFVTVVSFVT